MHRFTFELWPSDATDRTLPERTRPVFAVDIQAARANAAVQALCKAPPRPGVSWTVGAAIHARGQCIPAHPGKN